MTPAENRSPETRSTTILTVRRDDVVAMAGDGQVTLEDTVVKHRASKLRRLYKDEVVVGFAGAVGDAFTLLERLNQKLEEYQGNLLRSAHELAKQWRTDKMLRRLQSLIACVDSRHSLLISGSGEVIEPDDGVIGIGSGGSVATAAARALLRNTDMNATDIVKESLAIAAEICVYTNDQITVEELPSQG